jgi:hypothetical protein
MPAFSFASLPTRVAGFGTAARYRFVSRACRLPPTR